MDVSGDRFEDFAPIRPHQSFHVNAHLQTVLREFDAWYGPAKVLQRGQYEADRQDFAQLIARDVAHMYIGMDGYPQRLTTKTHFKTADNRQFDIEAVSLFENSVLPGGQVFSRVLESSVRPAAFLPFNQQSFTQPLPNRFQQTTPGGRDRWPPLQPMDFWERPPTPLLRGQAP